MSIDWGKVAHYRERAESFIHGMVTLDIDPDGYGSYGNAAALLAVHGSISLADAVLIAQEGERSGDDDHRAAVSALRKLCNAKRLDDGGIKHFTWLIQHKTPIAYGHHRIDDNNVKMARDKAEQFQAWVYSTFPEIGPNVGGE